MFWGVKLKRKKPILIDEDSLEGRRLHISQATLGLNAKEGERSIVKCKTSDGSTIFICSLSGRNESCSLDLNFEDSVIFTVTGSTPVHLCGYYMEPEELDDDEDHSDDDDEDYLDGFVVPDDEEDESSEGDDMEEERLPNEESLPSGVKIEEVIDEPAEAKAIVAEEPKKDDDQEDSEDADGFDLPSKRKVSPDESPSKKRKHTDSDTPETPAEAPSTKKNKKKKKKAAAAGDSKVETESPIESEKKKGKSSKKFSNGLEVQDVSMGKPDGKQAKPGKKVSIHYIGKLLQNRRIFDSTIGKRPFCFRLGVNEVVKGFDIGVTGMRVGDKRRVVIPPSMGYGAKAVGPIPPNSWLDFEIELIDVRG